jgi:LacI family transcriptional regulator
LTTVRQPLIEMGKTGARILLERIANPGDAALAGEILIEPELVVRESSGRVKA